MATNIGDKVITDITMYESISTDEDKANKFKVKAGVFLASVAGISALVGFGSTVAAVKKKDPSFFNKGIAGTREMTETGASLAIRALGWGALYAVGGCGVLFYAIWKLSGASNAAEFRMKMGSALPRIPKNNPPHGRTEFEGLTDLLNYISSGDRTKDAPTSDN